MKTTNQIKSILTHGNEQKSKIALRECVSNCLLGCIKLFNYTLTGSQAVKSDLIHSFFGTINHFFRYFTTLSYSQSLKDNYNFNYNYNNGYNLTRHFIVMAPGYFFISSGIYNITNPISWLVSGSQEITKLTISNLALSTISLANIGEFYLYYKSLGVIAQDSNNSFLTRMKTRAKLSYSYFQKKEKNETYDLILMEKILAISSSLTPLVTCSICFSTGLYSLDHVGQIFNGCLQVYLGYLISSEKTQILIGKSLSKEDHDKIIKIITASKEIEKVEDLKSSLTTGKLKISAEIKLNEKILAKYVFKRLEKDMRDSGLNPEEFKRVLVRFVYLLLAKTTEICESSEKRIQGVYEFAHSIDIEKGSTSMTPEETKNVETIVNEILREEKINQENIHK